MSRVPLGAGFMWGASLLLPACQWVGGYDDFSRGEESEPHACAVLPSTKLDTRGAAMARVDVPGMSCSWIDRDEVTVAQYAAWLADPSARETSWDADYCAWKDQPSDPSADEAHACSVQVRTSEFQPFAADKPIRCVDWCDAEAYCRWSGKRLCYDKLMGTQVPRNKPREWYYACTNSDKTAFPWPGSGQDSDCIVEQNAQALPMAERGPYAADFSMSCASELGVRNLIGNVAEWTYGCNFTGNSQDIGKVTPCLTRGGSYNQRLRSCIDDRVLPNDTRDPDLGFRCCEDLDVAESLKVSGQPLAP